MPETGYTPTWAYIGYLFCIRTPGDGQRTCQHQHQDGTTARTRAGPGAGRNQRPRRVAGRLNGVTVESGTGLAEGGMCVECTLVWVRVCFSVCVWAFVRTKRRTLKNGVNSLGWFARRPARYTHLRMMEKCSFTFFIFSAPEVRLDSPTHTHSHTHTQNKKGKSKKKKK